MPPSHSCADEMSLLMQVNMHGMEKAESALLKLQGAQSIGQQECTQPVITGGCESTKREVQSGNSSMSSKCGLLYLELAVTLS